MKERLTLNRKEQTRLILLNQIENKQLGVREAATLLNISERHAWRILAAYRREGAGGLAHGNRERKPVNALTEELRQQVIELAGSKYKGFNHTHLTEKLAECEGLHLSRSSLRSLLLQNGISSPRKRRPPKHRSRRERYPQEGMLLQTDGSEHDWLEGRGPMFCLIGAIDDATGKVPYALFQENEDAQGYMLMLRKIIMHQGIPLALYHDRHSIFDISEDKLPSIEEQLNGKDPLTQIGRLLKELGIESISAHSPQAKGRVERLWGTFQDRLTSELRLAGARTIEEANLVLARFLPDFNRRFAVAPQEPGSAYRGRPAHFKPQEFFCFKYDRTVANDNVVQYEGQRLQVLASNYRISYAGCKVKVHLGLDNSLEVYYQGHCLKTLPAPDEATALRKLALQPAMVSDPVQKMKNRLPVKPPANHPWRTYKKVIPIKTITDIIA
jgi:transposase